MDIKEIRYEFGDCDWMRAFLNGYSVDAVLWMMNRVEELEQQLKGGTTMSAGNCGSQVEAREGQVTQELNNAENAASRLVARIDELEAQLSGVLHEIQPAASIPGEAKESKLILVPLASRIENHYILLQTLGTRLVEILDRLEIR